MANRNQNLRFVPNPDDLLKYNFGSGRRGADQRSTLYLALKNFLERVKKDGGSRYQAMTVKRLMFGIKETENTAPAYSYFYRGSDWNDVLSPALRALPVYRHLYQAMRKHMRVVDPYAVAPDAPEAPSRNGVLRFMKQAEWEQVCNAAGFTEEEQS